MQKSAKVIKPAHSGLSDLVVLCVVNIYETKGTARSLACHVYLTAGMGHFVAFLPLYKKLFSIIIMKSSP